MKAMGIPRDHEAVACDVRGAKEYGRKPSDFGVAGRSGVLRSNFNSPVAKRATRRYWKRVDRAAGKRECSATL